jgi:hypothetical protein
MKELPMRVLLVPVLELDTPVCKGRIGQDIILKYKLGALADV